MARSGDDLGAAIWAAVKATQTFSPALSSADDAKGLALWKAIANAFYTYDNAHAVVTSSIPVNAISTAGSAASQTGPTPSPVSITGGLS